MLSSVQLLKEGNPGRKIAEIQGQLATVPLEPLCLSPPALGFLGAPDTRGRGAHRAGMKWGHLPGLRPRVLGVGSHRTGAGLSAGQAPGPHRGARATC